VRYPTVPEEPTFNGAEPFLFGVPLLTHSGQHLNGAESHASLDHEMHIAFVVPRFHPYKGGYENYILSLAEHLGSAGNRVSIFTTTACDLESFWLDGFRTFSAGKELYRSVEIHRLPILYHRWRRRASRILSLLPDWRLKARYSRPGFSVLGLSEALRKALPDLIHVGPLPYNSLMYTGIAEAGRREIPVLTTPCTHFGEDQNDEISRHYVQPFQIKMLNACNHVLTLTRSEAQSLMNVWY
jgi:glycosyltransferase involved in cell wall biosynthesis